MSSAAPAIPLTPDPALDPRRWVALGVVLTASFMVLLDVSIVNVAIPSIQRDLNATFGQIQLVLALYQMAYAVGLITGGRLGDIFGRKRLFMIGMTGFVVGSALCGAAPTANLLVVFRVLQGLMAALMYPQVLSVIQVSFDQRERPTAFAVFGATIGLATIAGPLLGGILIQANLFSLDWRPIFLVNVPVGVAALGAASLLLRESRSPNTLRLDLIGVGLVSAALFLLIWPLVEGRDAGWPLWAFACLIAFVPVFGLFVWFELRQATRNGSPLVEPGLFHNRSFVVGLFITLIFVSGLPAFFLTFSLFLQIGLGFSALHAGLTTLPFAVGSFIASAASARAAARLGRNILFIGSAVLLVGLGTLILSIHLAGIGLNSLQLYPALFVSGLGLGAVIAPLINVILAGIDGADAGSASGVLTTVQQIGGAMGVALIGVLFFGLIGSNAASVGRQVAPGMQHRLVAAGVPTSRASAVVRDFQRCLTDRASASDPTALPPSCRPTRSSGNARVAGVVAATAARALAIDFQDSFTWSLLYDVGAFALTFLLVIMLPRAAARRAQGGQ